MSWSTLVSYSFSDKTPAAGEQGYGGGSRAERQFALAMALTTMLVGAAFALF